jgi:hypothetical protein
MSTIAHKPPSTPTRPRRKVSAWLAGAIPVAAVTLVIALTPSGSDSERPAPSPNDSQTAPGVRYDGGPEEGTPDVSPPSPEPGSRPDGGPPHIG